MATISVPRRCQASLGQDRRGKMMTGERHSQNITLVRWGFWDFDRAKILGTNQQTSSYRSQQNKRAENVFRFQGIHVMAVKWKIIKGWQIWYSVNRYIIYSESQKLKDLGANKRNFVLGFPLILKTWHLYLDKSQKKNKTKKTRSFFLCFERPALWVLGL